MKKSLILFICISLLILSSCASQNKTHTLNMHPALNMYQENTTQQKSNKSWTTEKPPTIGEITKAVKNNEAEEKLNQMGDWWLFGPGMGRTALNIGTVIIFPPYALYLLTNAGLSFSGYEPIKLTDAIPEGPKEVVDEMYNDVTSIPGRVNAYANNKEFVSELSK